MEFSEWAEWYTIQGFEAMFYFDKQVNKVEYKHFDANPICMENPTDWESASTNALGRQFSTRLITGELINIHAV